MLFYCGDGITLFNSIFNSPCCFGFKGIFVWDFYDEACLIWAPIVGLERTDGEGAGKGVGRGTAARRGRGTEIMEEGDIAEWYTPKWVTVRKVRGVNDPLLMF